MTLIFTLTIIVAVAFVVATMVFPFTSSPLWDAVLIYGLYILGIAIMVLGVIGAVGLISGLL